MFFAYSVRDTTGRPNPSCPSPELSVLIWCSLVRIVLPRLCKYCHRVANIGTPPPAPVSESQNNTSRGAEYSAQPPLDWLFPLADCFVVVLPAGQPVKSGCCKAEHLSWPWPCIYPWDCCGRESASARNHLFPARRSAQVGAIEELAGLIGCVTFL